MSSIDLTLPPPGAPHPKDRLRHDHALNDRECVQHQPHRGFRLARPKTTRTSLSLYGEFLLPRYRFDSCPTGKRGTFPIAIIRISDEVEATFRFDRIEYLVGRYAVNDAHELRVGKSVDAYLSPQRACLVADDMTRDRES